jgi:hypothetical protein
MTVNRLNYDMDQVVWYKLEAQPIRSIFDQSEKFDNESFVDNLLRLF